MTHDEEFLAYSLAERLDMEYADTRAVIRQIAPYLEEEEE